MKKMFFTKGFVMTLSAGLYALVFLFLYAIPCFIDPTDCSGRDIAMAVLSMPVFIVFSYATLILPDAWFVPINMQMFLVFMSGIIQYGLIGYVLLSGIDYVRRMVKK